MSEHQKQTRAALKLAGLSDNEIAEILQYGEHMTKQLNHLSVGHKAAKSKKPTVRTLVDELQSLVASVNSLAKEVKELERQQAQKAHKTQVSRERKAIMSSVKGTPSEGLLDMLFAGGKS